MISYKGTSVAAQHVLVRGTFYRDGESYGHGLESRFAELYTRKIKQLGSMFLF